MSYKTGIFNPGIRSTRDFMEPIELDPGNADGCRKLTETLHTYGLALVRSKSFSPKLRSAFLDATLDYLCNCLRVENGVAATRFPDEDLRPTAGFQYGPTPIGEETALCSQKESHAACKAFVDRLEENALPFTIPGTDYPDHKGRFMSHLISYIGSPIADSPHNFVGTIDTDPPTQVYSDRRNVLPARPGTLAPDQWQKLMDEFGMMMLDPVSVVSEMLALGLGLERDYFTKLMNNGHHKVAPTFASYLDDRVPGTIQAALHQDIDVFAIHAQGTHSGLFVYTETGERLEVRVPEGCFLVQAGRQLYLKMRSMQRSGEITKKPIQPGWHEVVVTPDAVEKARPALEEIERILRLPSSQLTDAEKLARIRPLYRNCIRISCTFFYHFGDETTLVYGLEPGEKEEGNFPEGTKIQDYIGIELGFIKLS